MESFPSNSRELRAVPDPEDKTEKKIEKLVDNPVARRKKTLGSRLRELMFNGDNIVEYVVQDVILPAFKETLTEAVGGALDRALFGENGDRRPRRSGRPSAFGGTAHTNYNRYSTPAPSRNAPVRAIPSRRSNDFEDIIFATKVEANRILDQMDRLVDKYGQVTARDVYEMVGESFHYTDEKYGWTDLSRASTRRLNNGGYLLVLPRIEVLED